MSKLISCDRCASTIEVSAQIPSEYEDRFDVLCELCVVDLDGYVWDENLYDDD